MKEAIIYLLFDNWCNSEHEPEVKEAMDKAIQNPTENTIFQLSSITEANAFKAGVRECLKMFRELLVDNPEKCFITVLSAIREERGSCTNQRSNNL